MVIDSLKKAENSLIKIGQSKIQSKIDAEHILMSVLNKDKFALYMDYDKELSKLEQDAIEKILIKISEGYPLSYLINRHFFYDDEFYLDENVLIPRVETEGIIDKLLEYGDKIYLSKKHLQHLNMKNLILCA